MMMDIPVSFLVVTYNQEKYVEEAVVSALNQDYPFLEIVISDDGSSDGTWGVIKKTVDSYSGPHKIIIRQNKINSGLATNFNNGLKECNGELIVVQGGDDISRSDRVAKIVSLWIDNNRNADLLYSEVERITEMGDSISVDTSNPDIPTVGEIKSGRFFIAGGMSAAYSRRIFDNFGPLPDKAETEDYVLTFRAILLGGILHHPDPLVKYRLHAHSIMGQRRIANRYLSLVRYAYAAEAEAWDRLRSWDLSSHEDYLFRWKLARSYRSASIFRKLIYADGLFSKIGLLFLALFHGHFGLIKKFVILKIKA